MNNEIAQRVISLLLVICITQCVSEPDRRLEFVDEALNHINHEISPATAPTQGTTTTDRAETGHGSGQADGEQWRKIVVIPVWALIVLFAVVFFGVVFSAVLVALVLYLRM